MRAAAHALKEMEEGNLLEGCDLLGEAEVEIITRTRHTIHISKVRVKTHQPGHGSSVLQVRVEF